MFPIAVLLSLCVTPAPSAAESSRMSAYVSNLAHPRYAVREAASKRLVEAGGAAKGALREAAVKGDPETAARAKAALDSIVGSEVEALRPLPEADAAWYSVPDHTYSLPKHPDLYRCLKACGGGDPWPWTQYFAATEVWVRERLTAGDSPRLLRLILAEMHRKDGWFISRAGHDEPPWPVDPDEYRQAGRPAK